MSAEGTTRVAGAQERTSSLMGTAKDTTVALKLAGDPVQEGDGLTAQRSRRRGSEDTVNTTLLKNSRDMLTGSTLMNGLTLLLLILFLLKMLSMLKRGRERKERDRNRGRSARTTKGQIARTNRGRIARMNRGHRALQRLNAFWKGGREGRGKGGRKSNDMNRGGGFLSAGGGGQRGHTRGPVNNRLRHGSLQSAGQPGSEIWSTNRERRTFEPGVGEKGDSG